MKVLKNLKKSIRLNSKLPKHNFSSQPYYQDLSILERG